MNLAEALPVIRPLWIERVVNHMTDSPLVRQDLRDQITAFIQRLESVTSTEEVTSLDSTLAEWARSLTQSDLESSVSELTRFVGILLTSGLDICSENLPPEIALQLLRTLVPALSYTYERLVQYEIEAKMDYMAQRLAEVQQRLEHQDKSKSDFIAIAAHELKTPLTLVEGYSAMLSESIQQQKNGLETQLMLIDGIANGAQRLRSIIEDMIDVSLMDNQLLSLNIQPLWLEHLFSILERELSPAIISRQQHLTIHVFSGSKEMILGDPERLLQAFRNLLVNAIKFTPDGGHIEIDGRQLPGFIEIVIRYTGIGIAPEDQALIFEKFARTGNVALHSSGKTKFKGGGPGLGLPIAKGITEAHAGTIWVESEGYDETRCPGSTFHILLPKRPAMAEGKVAELLGVLSQSDTGKQSL